MTPYPKKTRPLPSILSPEEVAHLIDSSPTRSHRMVLMTLHGTGVPLCHSRIIFHVRVTRRTVPSKRIASAIWKFGLLKRFSFLLIRFNIREY